MGDASVGPEQEEMRHTEPPDTVREQNPPVVTAEETLLFPPAFAKKMLKNCISLSVFICGTRL